MKQKGSSNEFIKMIAEARYVLVILSILVQIYIE